MANTVTAVTMVNANTFSDYDESDVIAMIQNVHIFLLGKKSTITTGGSVSDNTFYYTEEKEASVLASMATKLLAQARMHSKSKQTDQEMKTLDDIWNDNPSYADNFIEVEELSSNPGWVTASDRPSSDWNGNYFGDLQ